MNKDEQEKWREGEMEEGGKNEGKPEEQGMEGGRREE